MLWCHIDRRSVWCVTSRSHPRAANNGAASAAPKSTRDLASLPSVDAGVVSVFPGLVAATVGTTSSVVMRFASRPLTELILTRRHHGTSATMPDEGSGARSAGGSSSHTSRLGVAIARLSVTSRTVSEVRLTTGGPAGIRRPSTSMCGSTGRRSRSIASSWRGFLDERCWIARSSTTRMTTGRTTGEVTCSCSTATCATITTIGRRRSPSTCMMRSTDESEI